MAGGGGGSVITDSGKIELLSIIVYIGGGHVKFVVNCCEMRRLLVVVGRIICAMRVLYASLGRTA
jgi:hypothetical protein